MNSLSIPSISAVLVGVAIGCLPAGSTVAAGQPGDWPTKVVLDSGTELGVKGLYQYDFTLFSGQTRDPATGKRLFQDAATWRRKEFDAYIKLVSGFEIDVGYDWQGSWADNYLKYSSDKAGEFRLGQFKTQVGWEEAESASALTFLERSLPDSAIYQGRRLGADWTYGKRDHWLFAAAYYYGGNLDGDLDDRSYSGRVVFTPIREKDQVLHFGLAASRELPDSGTASFGSKPEVALTGTRLIRTGTLTHVDAIDRIGLEVGWLHGRWFGQAEYLHLAARRDGGFDDFNGDGWYVFGAWMLTGESREYKSSYFRNPKPEHSYGAVELAARYSQLDLRDGAINGGSQHDWTLGVNWYLGQHFKMQANTVWAHAQDSPATALRTRVSPRVFEIRAQLSF